MAFFDRLGATTTEKSKDVAQKAKNFAETTKLGSIISTEEDSIARVYGEIGKSYFENHKDCAEDPFHDKIQEILSAQERIAQLRVQIQKIQGTQTCPQCGAEISDGAKFCPSCGMKVKEAVPVENAEQECGKESTAVPAEAESTEQPPAVCPKCGAKLSPDSAFCGECGTPLKIQRKGIWVAAPGFLFCLFRGVKEYGMARAGPLRRMLSVPFGGLCWPQTFFAAANHAAAASARCAGFRRFGQSGSRDGADDRRSEAERIQYLPCVSLFAGRQQFCGGS
jgi:ribosomal protein L40E